LDAQETREAINSLTAINNEALVIDLDAVAVRQIGLGNFDGASAGVN
jgi:hypothetical protein